MNCLIVHMQLPLYNRVVKERNKLLFRQRKNNAKAIED